MLGGLAGALLTPAAARADDFVVAGPPTSFVRGEITIDQGERVSLLNLDTLTHDVTARNAGPDGRPLFSSRLIGTLSTAPVEGVDSLTTGSYGFICSIHPYMDGTITVSSAGTPAPRPPGGGGGGGGGGADQTAPSLELRVLDSRAAQVRRRRSLRVRVTVNEGATATVTARVGRTTVGGASTRFDAAGSRTVGVRLNRAGRRLLSRRRSVRVSISARATDAAGNAATRTARATLRR